MEAGLAQLSLVGGGQSGGGAVERYCPFARVGDLRSHRLRRRVCPNPSEFNFIGDFWNDRISSLIVVSGVWRFYRDEYYKGAHWDLGPGYYESFFTEKGPDDVVSSFQAIALT
jgi:hypothetical protein